MEFFGFDIILKYKSVIFGAFGFSGYRDLLYGIR